MLTDTPPLANGRTAAVYAWEEGKILKLFVPGWPRDWVEYEARVNRAVHATGLNVPAVGDLLEVDGRLGLVYERVDGAPMDQSFSREPLRMGFYGRWLAELHAEMHAKVVSGLPDQRARLREKIFGAIGLSDALKQAALQRLETLPGDNRLCHGDFHPANILLTSNGPVIIDWVDATCGHPLADAARTVLLLSLGPSEPRWLNLIVQPFLYQIRRNYLKRYFELRPEGRGQFADWLAVVTAGRLSEDIPAERAGVIARVERAFRG